MPNQGPRATTSASGEPARRTAIERSGLGVVVLAAMAMASCDGAGDARFGVQYASDFAPARHMVSVLGVYENGRMSPGAWDTFAPHLLPVVGSSACGAGYDSLVPVDGSLASAIDEFARADGPTDDLLTQLAPAAKGDSILVITMSGQLPTKTKAAGGSAAKPQTSAGGGRRAGHPMHGPSRAAPSGPEADVLEISALLYSVAKGQSVGALTMQYSGASIDDAEAKFSLRLAQAFPSMGCVDWNWAAKVDAERIRASIDQ